MTELIEPKIQVATDLIKSKTEQIGLGLLSVRPRLEKLGATLTTLSGAYMVFDGFFVLVLAVKAFTEPNDQIMLSIGSRALEGSIGVAVMMMADEWKRSLWRRNLN